MIAGDLHKPSKRAKAMPQVEAADRVDQAKSLIADHPLKTVGGALVAGALVGLVLGGRRGGDKKKGMLRGMVGGIAMALIREAVLDRVSNYANSWIDTKSREETASRQRETESFLQH